LKLTFPLIRAMMERISIETDKQLILKPESEFSVYFRAGATQYRTCSRLKREQATAPTQRFMIY
jgi:hypothetical protein